MSRRVSGQIGRGLEVIVLAGWQVSPGINLSSDLMSSSEFESVSGHIGRGLQVSPGINFSSNCLTSNGEESDSSLIGQYGKSNSFLLSGFLVGAGWQVSPGINLSSDLMSSSESEFVSGQIGRGLQVSPGIKSSLISIGLESSIIGQIGKSDGLIVGLAVEITGG